MSADPRLCFPEFRAHSRARDRHLTEAEFKSLLSALPPSRQLWVTIAVYTGCRFSELEALRWEQHIALESRWIQIPGRKNGQSLAQGAHCGTFGRGPQHALATYGNSAVVQRAA